MGAVGQCRQQVNLGLSGREFRWQGQRVPLGDYRAVGVGLCRARPLAMGGAVHVPDSGIECSAGDGPDLRIKRKVHSAIPLVVSLSDG
jgi:hypothetical protein